MGGICVKPSGGSPWEIRSSKFSSDSRVSRSRRAESFRVKNRTEVRTGSIDRRLNSSRRVGDDNDHFEKIHREGSRIILSNSLSIGSIPKSIQGEQVVAGWPSWLADVAGEAINGWLPRRADTFEKLDKIGQGTYSNVYKARDLTNDKIVALKRVRFDNKDSESVIFMAREIVILRRLNHPNIIKLEGLITSRTSCSLYLVFEYMEHDLTGLISLPGVKFTEQQVKCYMKQLLSGLDHCHSNGVLHRDIKGSNLLIDNCGNLKIADFGLANFFNRGRSVQLTSRVVTLWYRPPELLLGATRYGVAVDMWSAGCILGELYAGKPIMPGRTEVEQLHRIFKLCGSPTESYWMKSKLPHSTVFKPAEPYKRRIAEVFKEFPSPAIALMEKLLAIDPEQRGTAALALKSELFTTEPCACDPSSLPKYPPSKEIDAKMRDDEAKKKRAARMTGQEFDKESRRPKETRAVPAPDANAELVTSMQRRRDHRSSHSRSEFFNKQDDASSFPIDQPTTQKTSKDDVKSVKRSPLKGGYSGPLTAGSEWTQVRKKYSEMSYDKDDVPASKQTKYQVGRSSESTEEYVRTRTHERRDVPRNIGGPFRTVSGRDSNKEPVLNGQGYMGNKIQFSGPLASSNVDQMLKDHDRHIQEAARRARLEKTRVR
ncbi:probable serine/threonine-protein kinase At1g54610 [Rutidosis leptorrhynchoides]|uniref:probable serine/threonine-protein kinase At1g54610 n=1 Tax=Rutidosis leptorrhynchoides TaxID=125765 RepID=UPI003A98D7FB